MNPILETDPEHMKSVWRQRALRLSRRPAVQHPEQHDMRVMVLEVGAERYGIELADVAEVLPLAPTTPVPGAAPFFAGVVNVHGEIRPVTDLKRLLQIESTATADGLAQVVLLRRRGRELGLIVDRVEQIRSIVSGNTQIEGDALSTRYLKGLRYDALLLLNTEALFTELIREDIA
jgi:purine-binding chemotaxis protein CheW